MRGGTLLSDLLDLLNTQQLASLGPDSRPDAQPIAKLDERMKITFQDIRLTAAIKDLLRATVYLWHDHLDEAHTIVQDIENRDASLVHAIMHRREPDYGNAKYWFRRVGVHPSFLGLAVKARELLEKADETDLHSRLLPNNSWDAFAFVDAVEDATHGQFASKTPLLQQIQKLEFKSFLENLANRI